MEETDLERRKTHEVVEVIWSGEGWSLSEREERRRRRWKPVAGSVVEDWETGKDLFFMEEMLKVVCF